MRLAVVLGAGGTVGIAHHIGAVRAISEYFQLSDERIDLLIGTSAGSIVAAYLRSGYEPSQLADRLSQLSDAAPTGTATHPAECLRRGLGSAYVLARSVVRSPLRLGKGRPTAVIRASLRSGLFSMDLAAGILERELPSDWPARALWLATFDLVTRRRVVLGVDHGAGVKLATAVQASCAIPGVYRPVPVGGSILVDGGAWSLTNMDLALLDGATHVIAVAPMAYDPARPPDTRARLLRALPTRLFLRDVTHLRRRGVDVLPLAPSGAEAATEGINLMRSCGLENVAEVAYQETLRHMAANDRADRWRRLLAG